MPDIDWIIEHETLPPDEPPWVEPEPPPPSRRRPPWWFWLAAGLVALVLGVFIYLWLLGGTDDPLPNPDPMIAQLEAAVNLEINALRTGDREIYDQLQDGPTRRSNKQPPPEEWFAQLGGAAGEVELVDLQLIDENSAQAEVKMTWNGVPYRLTWFYRQQEGRWLHTDWRPVDEEQTDHLTTPHIQLAYHPSELDQATATIGRLEAFVEDFCGLLPCPAEPFSATLEFADRLYTDYNVNQLHAPLRYQLPPPRQIRWPWNDQPEPVLLGSTGRRLAYKFFLQSAVQDLSKENQTALTVATFWLVHHLLELETPPTTHWLEGAARREGLPAAAAFIVALSQDIPSRTALTAAFRPETGAAAALPDYFGWLLMVDPVGALHVPPGYADSPLPRWSFNILEHFDDQTEPWAAGGQVYRQVAPAISSVRYQNDWAIATAQPGPWEADYFFRPANGTWRPSQPDETLTGELKTVISDPFHVTYYAWDEPFIPEILQTLHETYQAVTTNFDLRFERPISVTISPPPGMESLAPAPADVRIRSPNLYDNGFGEAAISLAGHLLSEGWDIERFPEEGIFVLLGVFLWQMDQLEYGVDTFFADVLGQDEIDAWRPPTTATAAEWMPLAQLWRDFPEGEPDGTEMLPYFHYPLLVVQYIVELYGVEKLPLMVDTLETANSLDEWISAVTGQPLDRFEADWREWVITESAANSAP